MPELNPMDTYELYEALGTGGGGTVFRAYHRRLQKNVVIKKIHSDIRDENERRMEVDILKNLHHPYLPQVFDYFVTDGTAYTVMDYVQGESFGQKLARGERFSERKVLKYAKQICEALDYLHSQKLPVIHGDIKPDNIMLTPEDNICLIDFNISGITRDNHAVTFGYTEGYGAPEQYREFQRISAWMASNANNNAIPEGRGRTEIVGQPAAQSQSAMQALNAPQSQPQLPVGIPIDKRSDIYSLGATLYHMYSGQILGRDTGNIINGKTSEGFLYILNKSLQENPDNRYQDAGQMLAALNNLYKRDRRYRNMIVRHAVTYIVLACVFLGGVYFILHGRDVYEKEQLAKYDHYIEELIDVRVRKQEDDFEEIFEEASGFMPDRLEAYYQKALYLYETVRYEDAVNFIRKNLDKNSTFYSQSGIDHMYYILGSSYFELGNYEDAADAFANAIRYNEENPAYYVDRAIALARIGSIDTAKEVLEDAEEKGALSGNIYLVNGEIKLAEEDYKGAEEDLRMSIAEAEDDYTRMRAYVMCARALLGQGATATLADDGIELLNEAADVLPGEYQAMILEQLTSMYMEGYEITGDRKYAEGALDTLKKIDAAGWAIFTTYDNMVNIYYRIGDYAAEAQLLAELAQKYPDNYKVPMKQAFLEVTLQAEKPISDRDYSSFADYYEAAQEIYSTVKRDGWSDTEMQVLQGAYQELIDGNWIE